MLDQYERGYGVPALTQEDEVTVEARRVLDLPPSLLRKLTAQECGEGAYVLRQFARRLQQAVNREQARVTWAEESIRKSIATRVNGYKGYSFEERKLQAVNDNDYTRKLDDIRVKAQLRIDRLAYLSGKANDQAMTLLSLLKLKGGIRE